MQGNVAVVKMGTIPGSPSGLPGHMTGHRHKSSQLVLAPKRSLVLGKRPSQGATEGPSKKH